jgi:diaminopimelate epimerase
MTQIYDARGNLYAVITPSALRELGIALPEDPAQAAASRKQWAQAAIDALCLWPDNRPPAGAKAHRSDGLLIGPFQTQAPYDVLIVNTDGTLAERSGNGLTIFSQFLKDSGVLQEKAFALRVHHSNAELPNPLQTLAESARVEGINGFWLDLGTPSFGPQAVGAQGVGSALLKDRPVSRVTPLVQLDQAWNHSLFVRIGNPHCVTLVGNAGALPSFAALHDEPLHTELTRIAFAAGELGAGDPCPAGVNLQWACAVASDQILARVFERGEGPTASSGTSASAVASACWRAGWVQGGRIKVTMPGGTAPIRLIEQDGELQQVLLFGVAGLQTC